MFPAKATSSEYPSCSLSLKCAACVRDVDFEDGASATSYLCSRRRVEKKMKLAGIEKKYERSMLGLSPSVFRDPTVLFNSVCMQASSAVLENGP